MPVKNKWTEKTKGQLLTLKEQAKEQSLRKEDGRRERAEKARAGAVRGHFMKRTVVRCHRYVREIQRLKKDWVCIGESTGGGLVLLPVY